MSTALLGTNQVERFIIANGGPGLQHIALTANDIISVTKTVADRGLNFVKQPQSYYEMVSLFFHV